MYGQVPIGGEPLHSPAYLLTDVGLVQTYSDGNIEVPREFHQAFHIVNGGQRRFGDNQQIRSTGQRCNRRTADARRTINNDSGYIMFLGLYSRLLPEQRNEPSGVCLRDPQPRMEERATFPFRSEPSPADNFLESNCLGRAQMDTKPASFTGTRVHRESHTRWRLKIGRHRDRIKPARFLTDTAGSAPAHIDYCLLATGEIVFFSYIVGNYEVQISGIDVTVYQHSPTGELGQRSG
jgi:hypothetical protein